MYLNHHVAIVLSATLFVGPAFAQKLPPPSRTVYKCQEAGKVAYSDAPCLGAEKIDVQPTRGLNKFTDKELIGNDVRHEKSRELMADALRPLTGMDAAQLDRSGRRMKLSTSAQQRCKVLDQEIPELEEQERVVPAADSKAVQKRLFELRTEFRAEGCQ